MNGNEEHITSLNYADGLIRRLKAKLELAYNALEQVNHYLEAEAYTKAWKETVRALEELKEDS